jgi:ribosome-associated toxin RatA of RatAB toxin-antitoxin module
MASYRGQQRVEIAARPQECFEALTDYEHLHEWQRAVCSARVVGREGDAELVEYEVDAKLTKLHYRLRQTYDPPRLIESEYAGGSLRSMSGRWTFSEVDGDRTLATVEIEADPGRWVPGPVKRLVEDALLRRAVEDLRRHVESA